MSNKLRVAVLLAALLLPVSLPAEETHRAQFSGGYTYMRADVSKSFSPSPGQLFPPDNLNMNGWNASFAWNFSNLLGVVADVSGAYNNRWFSPEGPSRNRLHNFIFGPRLTHRVSEKFQPFVHGLFGVSHAAFRPGRSSSVEASENAFAMALGGGLDCKISERLSVRLAQADYFLTRFGNNQNQNNFRVSTGIVIGLRKGEK